VVPEVSVLTEKVSEEALVEMPPLFRLEKKDPEDEAASVM
jgi:hypothetical protein